MIDVINDNKKLSTIEEINKISIEDDYFELINILQDLFVNNDNYDIAIDINRVENLENNRYKSYGCWLLSKLFYKTNRLDEAYK